MITIQGKGVSAGVGVGPLYFYRRATAEIKRYTVEDTDAEWHRFKGAQTGAIEQLGVLAEQARKEAGDGAVGLHDEIVIVGYVIGRAAGDFIGENVRMHVDEPAEFRH